MGILFIIALVISALLLLLVELFIIPGSSLAAILSIVCLVWAVAYAFINISALAGIITLVIAVILGSLMLIVFMRSKTLDKVALTEDVASTVDRTIAANVQVGDKGYAITRLAYYCSRNYKLIRYGNRIFLFYRILSGVSHSISGDILPLCTFLPLVKCQGIRSKHFFTTIVSHAHT